MGSVYDQFQAELAIWDNKYAGRPRRQMIRLFLLALEREEIVSVGYREDLIAARLKAMPISEEEREIIRHALLWTWKDEEMHAIYIRGAIFKIGNFPLRARAFLRQLAGAIDRIHYRKSSTRCQATSPLSFVSGFLPFQCRCGKDSVAVLAASD